MAILGWLRDPRAPRVCVISGDEGCGKSLFLAWLAEQATRPDAVVERRVHGLVPLAGQSALTASWLLAEQLGSAARTPGDLIATVAADRRRTVIVLPDLHHSAAPEAVEELICALARFEQVRLIVETREVSAELSALSPAVMDLRAAQWRDEERYAVWAASAPSPEPDVPSGGQQVAPDLDDPSSVCAIDPVQVTALYELSEESHGGLRAAWLRAGGALTRPCSPAERALMLWAALGDDADPRLADELQALAHSEGWAVRWKRVRGDISPPWPGPALALSIGVCETSGSVAVLDHQGIVRLVAAGNGEAHGRLPHAVSGATAVAFGRDGDLTVLDGHGRMTLQHGPTVPRSTGIASLLETESKPLEQLVAAVEGSATTVACVGGALAYGDGAGAVRVMMLNGGTIDVAHEALHEGAVTGLAGLELAEGAALVYSGGQDGRVRMWAPGRAPLASALRERNCSVTALSAALTPDGPVLVIGWEDGLVEYSAVETEPAARFFRPGAPVRSVAALANGDVLVGTDEMLVCLTPS
ncbi:WD40 repeat domain-containing protein [Streptomyces sp. NBC_01280]|uniref:WD40 repeat domain-containing protein n=1 Tax=Streptomyces sp. NBC_01280 TaxID=2903810 RepID=UPI002E359936|nr:WD40 repeat domain-containing protein [Streptomyces sp. NBC_01280]